MLKSDPHLIEHLKHFYHLEHLFFNNKLCLMDALQVLLQVKMKFS